MAQTTATKDEDLLIISDDNQTETSLDTDSIDFSLEDNSVEKNKTEEVIDFSESLIKEELTSEPVIETAEEEVKIDSPKASESDFAMNDFSLDLWEESQLQDEEKVEIQREEKTEMWSFDLGTSETETVKKTIEETSKQETSNMWTNDILNDTIAKFERRQEKIALEKEEKRNHVSDLKKQIKNLETEVTINEEEISSLVAEWKKITLNVKSLEKMKLGDISVTKKHNSKRVLKK